MISPMPVRFEVRYRCDMPLGTSVQWEELFKSWDEVVASTTWEKLNESAVACNFATKLVELLDWMPTQRHFGVHLTLRVGSGWQSVFPDIVFASSAEDAKTPGKVFAVLELKRPGLADDDARQQAQCYADHLRAPVYAVIDGQKIRVWLRRLVHSDREVLTLARPEFGNRYDEIRNHLGRSQLEDLRARLMHEDDDVAKAQAVVAKNVHDITRVRLRLEGRKVWSSISRDEFLQATRWWGRATGTFPEIQLGIAGTLEEWAADAPDLVHEIGRLVMHSEPLRLAVEEPDRWNAKVLATPSGLLPHPKHAVHSLDPQGAELDLGDPALLAEDLRGALDLWTKVAVEYQLAEVVAGRGNPDFAVHWGKETVREHLKPVWKVTVSWLKSALRMSGSDDAPANLRFGPRSVPVLVDAVLFATAVTHVLTDLRPGVLPSFPNNVGFQTSPDSPPTDIGFASALSRSSVPKLDTFLLLLSSSSLTPAQVRSGRQRIGAPPESTQTRWRISTKDVNGIVCCLSDDARALLRDGGWTPFVDHLTTELRNQHALEGASCPPSLSTPSVPPSSNAGTGTN